MTNFKWIMMIASHPDCSVMRVRRKISTLKESELWTFISKRRNILIEDGNGEIIRSTELEPCWYDVLFVDAYECPRDGLVLVDDEGNRMMLLRNPESVFLDVQNGRRRE